MLRPEDQETLEAGGRPFQVATDGAFTAVVIEQFPIPAALEPQASTLLLRLPPGFPDAGPDMFWFDPPVIRASGGPIPGTESREPYLGRVWQRWSRHIQGQWRPGIDTLETYLAYVRRCLDHAAGKAA